MEMDNNNKKRGRSSNFSNEEKLLLLQIIKKYKGVIENKQSGGTNWKMKQQIWTKIAMEFNSSTTIRRSTEVLKRFYNNQKKQTRKQACKEKSNASRTGGGPHFGITTDPIFNLTLDIMNKKSVYGLTNPHDDDSTISYLQNLITIEDAPVVVPVIETNNYDDIPPPTEIDDYESPTEMDDPAMDREAAIDPSPPARSNLRRPKPRNRRPKTSKLENVALKYEEVAAMKKEVFGLQKDYFKEKIEWERQQRETEESYKQDKRKMKKRAEKSVRIGHKNKRNSISRSFKKMCQLIINIFKAFAN